MKTVVLRFWRDAEATEEWDYDPEVNQGETIEEFIHFLDELRNTDSTGSMYTITARLVED